MACLARLGMIRRVETPEGEQRHYYARLEHPVWDFVAHLIELAQQ